MFSSAACHLEEAYISAAAERSLERIASYIGPHLVLSQQRQPFAADVLSRKACYGF